MDGELSDFLGNLSVDDVFRIAIKLFCSGWNLSGLCNSTYVTDTFIKLGRSVYF